MSARGVTRPGGRTSRRRCAGRSAPARVIATGPGPRRAVCQVRGSDPPDVYSLVVGAVRRSSSTCGCAAWFSPRRGSARTVTPGDGAVAVEVPLLVGAAGAVVDDDRRAVGGASAGGVEALVAVHPQFPGGGADPLLVRAGVAVVDGDLGVVRGPGAQGRPGSGRSRCCAAGCRAGESWRWAAAAGEVPMRPQAYRSRSAPLALGVLSVRLVPLPCSFCMEYQSSV